MCSTGVYIGIRIMPSIVLVSSTPVLINSPKRTQNHNNLIRFFSLSLVVHPHGIYIIKLDVCSFTCGDIMRAIKIDKTLFLPSFFVLVRLLAYSVCSSHREHGVCAQYQQSVLFPPWIFCFLCVLKAIGINGKTNHFNLNDIRNRVLMRFYVAVGDNDTQ